MIPVSWYTTAGATAAAALFLSLYIDAKSDIKAEIERCNTDKLQAVAEAERITRDALQQAMEDELAQREKLLRDAQRAREIAEEAARLADARVPEVIEVIRESTDACLDTSIDTAILKRLRN